MAASSSTMLKKVSQIGRFMDIGISPNATQFPRTAPCADEDGSIDDLNPRLRSLIAAAARGDCGAFEEFYKGTARWLLARVRWIAGDTHAEDVMAEVYLQVWRSLPLYQQERGQPLAWLATIARSRALDRLRCERRAHGGLLDAPPEPDEEESHDLGPELLLAIAERDRLLKVSMGALSPKEQLVLGMAYFRDCTQLEIAALTGMPLGSVKTLMTRSQRKLRVSIAAAEVSPRMSHNGVCATTP
jgi:RNA polymerase sigma-70 factor (ECF subfamily)